MHDHRSLDLATALSAAAAAMSFWQGVALALTIISATIAVICGCIRIYDRVKYGPIK